MVGPSPLFQTGFIRTVTIAIFTLVCCLQIPFICLIPIAPKRMLCPSSSFCAHPPCLPHLWGIHLCNYILPCSPCTVLNFEQLCTCALLSPSLSRSLIWMYIWMMESLQTGQIFNLISLAQQTSTRMRKANIEYFLCARHLAGFISSKLHQNLYIWGRFSY